jgi:type IV secretion system protein VirB10
MGLKHCALPALALLPLMAQEPAKENTQAARTGWRSADEEVQGKYVVQPGTRVPLSLINSVSTKHSAEGDRVYLETVFPILVDGRVVIPPGSYVAGTITQVKRPGRVKGRGELFLRFDSLTLPNGVTRDFRARVGSLDGRGNEELDRTEGKVLSESNKGGDARTVGEAAAAGASVGVIAGHAAGRTGMGAGIGAAAGAAAGMMGVLLTRGPDAVLAKGSTIEMVLDRPLVFSEEELDFSQAAWRPSRVSTGGGGPVNKEERRAIPMPGRRWPLGRLP